MSSDKEIYVALETITPEIALQYLEQNTANFRGVNRKIVDKYSNDMKTGHWETTGDSIVFDTLGRLKNGQHRLLAIKSGVPMKNVPVVRNVDPSTDMYDTNYKRNNHQILVSSGLEKCLTSTYITAAARMVAEDNLKPSITSAAIIREYLLADADTWEKVYNYTKGTFANKKSPLLRAGCIVAIYFALSDGYRADIMKEFCNIVTTGFPVPGKESTAPIMLRNYLMLSTKNVSGVDVTRNMYDFTSRALLDYAAGKSRRYRYTEDTNAETYFHKSVKRVKERLRVDF